MNGIRGVLAQRRELFEDGPRWRGGPPMQALRIDAVRGGIINVEDVPMAGAKRRSSKMELARSGDLRQAQTWRSSPGADDNPDEAKNKRGDPIRGDDVRLSPDEFRGLSR